MMQVQLVMELFAIFVQLARQDNILHFLHGKYQVSPVKPVSLPLLELTTATIAIKLSTFVCNQLKFDFDYAYYWTDAMIVLW